jgi:hypothetical protein
MIRSSRAEAAAETEALSAQHRNGHLCYLPLAANESAASPIGDCTTYGPRLIGFRIWMMRLEMANLEGQLGIL